MARMIIITTTVIIIMAIIIALFCACWARGPGSHRALHWDMKPPAVTYYTAFGDPSWQKVAPLPKGVECALTTFHSIQKSVVGELFLNSSNPWLLGWAILQDVRSPTDPPRIQPIASIFPPGPRAKRLVRGVAS